MHIIFYIVSYLSNLITIIRLIPQLIHTYKLKDVESLSKISIFLQMFNSILLISYSFGLLELDDINIFLVLIIPQIFIIVFCVIQLYLIKIYIKKDEVYQKLLP